MQRLPGPGALVREGSRMKDGALSAAGERLVQPPRRRLSSAVTAKCAQVRPHITLPLNQPCTRLEI